MEDKNSLIDYKESIFKKIINWFKNIFKKSDKKEIIENDFIEQEQPKNTKLISHEKSFSYNTVTVDVNKLSESEKEKFFKFYNDVKSKKINVENLSTEDLKKFNIMIKEEVLLKQNKLDDIDKENEEISKKISELERKNNLSD